MTTAVVEGMGARQFDSVSAMLLVHWHLEVRNNRGQRLKWQALLFLTCMYLWQLCVDAALMRSGGARLPSPAVRSCTSSLYPAAGVSWP